MYVRGNSKTNSKDSAHNNHIVHLNSFYCYSLLFKDKEISKSAIGVYSIIKSLDITEKGCFVSNKTIAEALNISSQQVSNCIQLLKKKGFIRSKNNKNQFRSLRINNLNEISSAYNYSYNPPINTVIGHIIYNNSFILKELNASFPTGEKKLKIKKEIKIPKSKLDILSQWNSYSYTPNHREGTQIHSKINRYVNQLIKGTFSRHNSIDKEFLSNNKLPANSGTRQYLPRQIKSAVRQLSYMFKEGMEPKDKSWLKGMNLATLIFNERSRKSQLLKCMYWDVSPVSEVMDFMPETNEDWITQLEGLVDEDKLTHSNRVTFRKNMNMIDKYYDWMWEIPLTQNPKLRKLLPDENVFFDWYVKWLHKKPKVNPAFIGPRSKDWPTFLLWLTRDCLNYDISIIDSDYDTDIWSKYG